MEPSCSCIHVKLPQVATRLQTSTSRNDQASILVDKQDDANSKEVEEGSNESNDEKCNDECTDDEVGDD